MDCDVLQADGGTRCAAINGAWIAAADAVTRAIVSGIVLAQSPITGQIAAVSVGVIDSREYLDLDYDLDHRAEVDMNIARTDTGRFVEIQGTAEAAPFSDEQLTAMLALARDGIEQIMTIQKQALED